MPKLLRETAWCVAVVVTVGSLIAIHGAHAQDHNAVSRLPEEAPILRPGGVAPVAIPAIPPRLRLGVSSAFIAGSDAAHPTWVVANRDATVIDARTGGDLVVDLSYRYPLTPVWSLFAAAVAQAGFDGSTAEPSLPIAFFGVRAGPFALHGGRYPLRLGDLPAPGLSSGSLAVGSNAIPIARITGRTMGYIDIPGLNGAVQTKFGMSHGWFEEDRSTANALLHEKWLYLQLRAEDRLSVYGGLVHHVMWAGTSPDGSQLPGGIDEFFRVFAGQSGGNDASESDQINKAGDAFGIWDLGLSTMIRAIRFSGYYQHFYEGGSSLRLWANGLDGLRGVVAELDHGLPIVPDTLLYERVRTDYQGGPFHDKDGEFLFGRQSYFQNAAYLSGWTHHSRMVGSPLILTSGSGTDTRISSNRIRARHIGATGRLASWLRYRALISIVGHSQPAYTAEPIDIDSSAWQYDWLLELAAEHVPGTENLAMTLGVAITHGDLNSMATTVFGGVRYRLY